MTKTNSDPSGSDLGSSDLGTAMTRIAADTGTAYGRPKSAYMKELAEVSAGTPMGELLRRYWHPIGVTSDAGATPRQVRILGEDLILFRDGSGLAGRSTAA